VTEPTPLGDLLGDLLRGLGVANPDSAVALLERWRQLAPSPWAERAVPVSLRNGVLEVAVADGTTASLLRYQASQLVEELCSSLGAGLVSTVTITVDRHRERP
jgi:predicted nucleic acid-binding Zn ribbon protein